MNRSVFVILTLLSLLVSACSIQYKVAATFDDFNEVFVGTGTTRGRISTLEFTSEKSSIRCSGKAWETYRPPGSALTLVGIRGEVYLECTDGRKINAKYLKVSRTVGIGEGIDQNGNVLHFKFSLSDEEFRTFVTAYRESVKGKPELPPVYEPKKTRKKVGFSSGTGFFISDQGHFLTNFHVIQDSKKVTVLIDGEEVSARLLKKDVSGDVALLKIEKRTLPVNVGSTREVSRGDEVFTLGYPLLSLQGQEQKASFGRVNALSGIKDDIHFMQIDVPIQPGNSGGPLFNSRGEVIGIVTATLDVFVALRLRRALPQNVNYTVKSDYVLPMLEGIPGKALTPTEEQPFRALARRYKKSVILVIAR